MAKIINPLTIVQSGSTPSLGTKSIVTNGTYAASSDGLDGYSSVTVNVPPTLFRSLVDKSITTVTADDLNGLTSIGSDAFRGCTALTSITIPDSVTSIGGYAFYYCSDLTSVTIGNGVTSIGYYAFSGCTGLESLTIGNSVTSIGNYAFFNCTGLTGITVLATTPPTVGLSGFINTNNCPIFVPAESVSAYQSAWTTYADRIQAIPQ